MALIEDLLIRVNGQDNGASAMLRNLGKTADGALGEGGGLAKYAGLAKGALLGLGGTMTAGVLVSGLKDMVTRTAEIGDKLNDMSQRTGIAVRDLGGLSIGARQTGTSLETVEGALRRLVANAAAAKDPLSEQGKTFARLGISVTDVNGQLRPARDLLFQVAERMRTTTGATERMAIAQDLLGRSGAELIPMLLGGAKGLEELQAKAEATGVALSAQAADEIAQYNDAMDDLDTAWQGVGQTVGLVAIPILTRLTNEGLLPALQVIKDLVGQTARDQRAPITRLELGIQGAKNQAGFFTEELKKNTGELAPFGEKLQIAERSLQGINTKTGGFVSAAPEATRSVQGVKEGFRIMEEKTSGAATALDTTKQNLERLRPQLGFANDDLDHFDDMLSWVAGKGQDGRGGLEGVDSGLKDVIETSGLVNLDDIAFPPMADWVQHIGEVDSGLQGVFETARQHKTDLSDIAPPPAENWRSFAQSLGNAFTEPAGKEVVQTALISSLSSIAQGGSFKQALGGIAVAIGSAVAGPMGGAIASGISSMIYSITATSNFAGKRYEGITGEAVAAFKQGGIGMLQSTALTEQQRQYQRGGRSGQSAAINQLGEEIRKQLPGLNVGQANDMAQALLTNDFYGARGQGLNEIIRAELIRQQIEELQRAKVMSGISEAAQAQFSGGVPAWSDLPAPPQSSLPPPPEPSLPPPPGPSAKPAVPTVSSVASSPQARAATLLARMLQDNTVSRQALRDIGMDAIGAAANQMGGVWPSFVGPLRGVLAGSPHDETWLRSRGIDIVARQGMWRVPGGEHEAYPAVVHGQERILSAAQARAMDAGLGDFEGSAGPVLVFNNYITAMDGRDMESYVQRRLGPAIERFMQTQTRRGVKMIYSKGVLTPPTT